MEVVGNGRQDENEDEEIEGVEGPSEKAREESVDDCRRRWRRGRLVDGGVIQVFTVDASGIRSGG